MTKEQKTAEELKALLDERIAPYQLGREVNPRWVKIVPADPDKEGANWKVSHSSRTAPTGVPTRNGKKSCRNRLVLDSDDNVAIELRFRAQCHGSMILPELTAAGLAIFK